MALKKIYISSHLQHTDKPNWPRLQRAETDGVLGALAIASFGVDDGQPWIEIQESDLWKVRPPVSYNETAPRRLRPDVFMDRFTGSEKKLILFSEDLDVKLAVEEFRNRPWVDLDHPLTVAYVNGLESAGLIGAGRAAEILA